MAEGSLLELTDGARTGEVRNPLWLRRVTFVGRLGSMTLREAQALVRRCGGTPLPADAPEIQLVILGADSLPDAASTLLPEALRGAVDRHDAELLLETQLWERLGLVDDAGDVRRLYTPAMLADLLGVSVRLIRRWHTRGLIRPAREVHRLPYFDFQEVLAARKLGALMEAGTSPRAIEQQVRGCDRFSREGDRALTEPDVFVAGGELLIRTGERLVDARGQQRIVFPEVADGSGSDVESGTRSVAVLNLMASRQGPEIVPLGACDRLPSRNFLSSQALACEEAGDMVGAIESTRGLLLTGPPTADLHFSLAELLYRVGDTAGARERYYSALELDEDFVEARANLGCVLAEEGEWDLAVAAFQGALERHPDYPDAHHHLAQVLTKLGRDEEAAIHWRIFESLAPGSPWSQG